LLVPPLAVLGQSRRVRELFLIGISFIGVLATAFAAARLADTTGLDCQDYANLAWAGPPFQTRVERDFARPLFATRPASMVSSFSTECRGTLAIVRSGTFRFSLLARTAADVWIGDRAVVRTEGPQPQRASDTIDLTAGQHQIRFRYALAGRADEPELLMARAERPLRPLNPLYVSRQSLPAAAYVLRVPARAAPVLLPLLWIVVVAYRLRPALARSSRWTTLPVVRWHGAFTASTSQSLTAVVIVAVAVRLALTLGTYPILWPDSEQYYDTALYYVRGEFLPHNLLSTPLFPAFLAAFLAVDITPAAGIGLIAAQRALAIVATVLVYRLAREAFDKTVAFYAALVWTISAVQLYYETVVATEALFVVVLLVAMTAAARMLQSDSPLTAAIAGLTCAVATLTRPVAKGLVFIVLAVVWWQGRTWRRLGLTSAVLLGTFYLALAPWMYVNRQTYGFWGVSGGEGLWLFLRAFDIDELDPPAETRFPEVREVFDALRPDYPYLHYAVRDELNYHRGYSAHQADEVMWGFALETVAAHPVRFALGTAKQWVLLLVNPYSSVQICDSADGPHLCSERGRGLSYRAFPNEPMPDRTPLKRAIAAYFRAAYWILPVLAPVAVIGIVRVSRERDPRAALRALLATTILYLTLAAAVFNTVQDRYRLPADAFVVMFAIHELRRHGASLLKPELR